MPPPAGGLKRISRSLDPGARTLGGIRTRIHMALNHARLPDCGTSVWSLRAESNRLPVPYEGTALPGELQRHGCPPWIRTTISRVQSPVSLPVGLMGIEVRKARVERASRED